MVNVLCISYVVFIMAVCVNFKLILVFHLLKTIPNNFWADDYFSLKLMQDYILFILTITHNLFIVNKFKHLFLLPENYLYMLEFCY